MNSKNTVYIYKYSFYYAKRSSLISEPGWLSPASGCARAVTEAKQRLEAAGYKVVPFNPPDINKVCQQ